MNVLSKKGGRNSSLVPQSLDNNNTVKDSMQYYRVWICSCNWVLGITSAIFTVFAAFVLADIRLSLLRGIELYHPTFIYAYAALIIQCGVIQTVGCLGAKRLNHKLLSVYWILLLLLTIGDVAVGLVWVFKLEDVKLALRPILTKEFIAKYATDADFTKTWNRVQTQEHCCGVNGPLDFDKFSAEVRMQIHQEQNAGRTDPARYLSLPDSCCTSIDLIPPPTQDYAFGPFSLSRPPDRGGAAGVSRSVVPPTTLPRPLALFLNLNYSNEETSEEWEPVPIPGLVSMQKEQPLNRHRHFVHYRKKAGLPPGVTNELNNSSSLGESPSTEEPLEVPEISVPFACRNPEIHDHSSHQRRNIPPNPQDDNGEDQGGSIDSFLTPNKVPPTTMEPSVSGGGGGNVRRTVSRRHASIPYPTVSTQPASTAKKNRVRIYRNGCGLKLMQWLDHISGILFILGFCIIGFIKACFLIILRYEIREMIEKIHTLDQAEDELNCGGSTSPSRLALLQKQSSLSSGQCHFTGVTIKSPQGDGGPKCFHERNSFISATSIDGVGGRHHGCCSAKREQRDRTGMRRPSGRSLCECDRHSSHSQETVNMTLMITTQAKSQDDSTGGGPDSEPISLIVPKTDEREIRRSRFANYAAWDSNVSAESSTSTGGVDYLSGGNKGGGKTEVVQVEMENLSSIQFVDEQNSSEAPSPVPPANPNPNPVEEELSSSTLMGKRGVSGDGSGEEVTTLLPQTARLAASRRRNGNNNSVDSSDSVMALIGTAV